MTDEWRSYSSIEEWGDYRHFKINHSENFVQPKNKEVHTQNIESLWQKLKRRHKEEFGTSEIFLETYIADFSWRQEFGGDDCLYNFWRQISNDPRYICEK